MLQNNQYKEKELHTIDGWIMLLITMLLIGFLYLINIGFLTMTIMVALLTINMSGFFILNPNEALVATFFGKYVGTTKSSGLHWTNPFNSKRKISLKIQNLTLGNIKVNDKAGNPIEIGTVFIWRIKDTAKALFAVENYEIYFRNHCDAVLRKLATIYHYDGNSDMTFKNNADEIAKVLKENISKLVNVAGLELEEAKYTHLAYAPEIAQAMLKKQQSLEIMMARKQVVESAMNMVEEVLNEMEDRELAEFGNEDKVKLITSLMTALIGDSDSKIKEDKEKPQTISKNNDN